ncbi:kynureninase [Massilia sp. W12]|uniref:kynureninase n=1 Tax=Massilia sp. W12 TaxID=3126507 RepID=UPI0030CAE058
MLTREDCLQLDAKDTISALRDAFDLPEGLIYLDGNSLGAKPKAASLRAQQVVDQQWGQDLIQSWNKAHWFELPMKLGMQMLDLLGAWPNEVAVTDTTSVNLFKALAFCLKHQAQKDPARKKIISERSNFPSDLYIAQGLSNWLEQGHELVLLDDIADLPKVLNEECAVLMLTHVNYRSGAMLPMQEITALAHQHGALMLWDLAHSAGAVPLDLRGCDADLAVGCTYKYLNGGPGAPAFIWIHSRFLRDFEQPLSGWWSHIEPFAMRPEYRPTPGIGRALCGTQCIVSMSLVECGLDVFARTDMQAIRAKSLALGDLMLALLEQECAGLDVQVITPREHARRGSQICLAHPHAYGVMQALIKRGVVGDYRAPDIMRFGLAPLYVRFVDIWDAVYVLKEILQKQEYDPDAIPLLVS